MISQLLALALFVAACQSGAVEVYPGGHPTSYGAYDSYQAPIYGHGYGPGYGHGHEEYAGDHHAYPKYKYSYGVSDPHTGDHKSQAEYRDGDVVKGHYTVADPDGTLRVVHYTADDHNGFNAVVEKHGQSIHPQPIHQAPIIVEKVLPIVENVVYEKPAVYAGYGGHGAYGAYGGGYGGYEGGYGGYGGYGHGHQGY